MVVAAFLAAAACGGHSARRAVGHTPSPTGVKTTSTSVPAPLPTEPALPPAPGPDAVPVSVGPLAPVFNRIATAQPVVFITIDDGWVRDNRVIDLVRSNQLPVTVFLLNSAARGDVGYFRALQAAGATIEDHTLTHPYLNRLPEPAQEREICGAAAQDAALFGARPTLVRPPYGAMNNATRVAAHHCGLRAVVQWDATMDGRQFVVRGGRLQPGDIVILHFRPTLFADLTALLDRIHQSGLTIGHLESYLG